MQQRYRLPVNVLLQALRDQKGITVLSASLPSVPGYQQEAGEVVLMLGQGHVQTCTIRSRDDLLLVQGGEALKALEQLGSLEWSVQGFRGSGDAWPKKSSTEAAYAWPQEHLTEEHIPRRRVAALPLPQQETLPRRQRQVFALSDGTHSVATIATLLHLSTEEVARLLHELQHDQLID